LQNDNSINGINIAKRNKTLAICRRDYSVCKRPGICAQSTNFTHAPGLEINATKTEEIWLDALKNGTDIPYNFKWPQEPSWRFFLL